MRDKIKKISAVIFLTLLVWAWAYLALEKIIPSTATLYISPATRDDLFVSFEDLRTPINLRLAVKGPPSKITELNKKLREDEANPNRERTFSFFYNAEIEGHSAPGLHVLEIVSFLNESDKMKNLGISVESCIPSRINVNVEQLTKQYVTVQCLDENNVPLTTAQIEPQSVEMYVRQNWTGKASVILTEAARENARKDVIEEAPFIEFAPGIRRHSKQTVKIKLPATEHPLQDQVADPLVRLGYIFSKDLQGKYTVKLLNESKFRTLNFKASQRAFEAYQKMPFQMLIEIQDSDINETLNIHCKVIYNFPTEFVRKGEIVLTSPTVEAELELVPVANKPE